MAKHTPDHEHDPRKRAIRYRAEETSLGFFNVELRGLTQDEVAQLLRQARKAIKAPLRGADGSYFVVTRGRPSGTTAVERDEYEATADRLRPKYRRRSDLVKAMAQELILSEETIRNYKSERGWRL